MSTYWSTYEHVRKKCSIFGQSVYNSITQDEVHLQVKNLRMCFGIDMYLGSAISTLK